MSESDRKSGAALRVAIAEQGVAEPPASYAGRPRQTRLEYEAILANASIGIAFTRDRKFFLCNPKFAAMFGWDADALIGQSGDVVYVSRDDYEAFSAMAQPILGAGELLDFEREMRRKDGTRFLCRGIARAVNPADTKQGTIWIAEDITQRRRAAEEVERLLREQRVIFETASIGIAFLKDRRIARCNRRFEQMYGYAPGRLVGKTADVLFVDDAQARVLPGDVFSTESLARRMDGTTFWSRIAGRSVDPADPTQGSVWLAEDVSERRHAEDELARVLAEQQALLNNVVVGIAFVRDRCVMRCNPRFEELFGFAPGTAIGMSVRQVYFTDAEFEQREQVYAAVDRGEAQSNEMYLRRLDGSGFWCRLSGRAVAPGDPTKGYVWLFEDVTERRHADESARRLFREQELILDNVSIGIAFVRNTVIQRGNRRLADMLGYAPGELDGRSTAVLFETRDEWEKAVREAYGSTPPGGAFQAERRYCRRDGTTFPGRVRGRRIDAGAGDTEWIWIYEDITAEREAIEARERALAEQRLIVDNATIGIAFVRQRIFQRCNPKLEQMFGYASGEMLGKSARILYASGDDFERIGAEAYARLAVGETHVSDLLQRRKDGSEFWCRVVGRAIDPARPHEGSIWIYEDITADRQTRDTLERAVAERTTELEAANQKLAAEIAERRQAEQRAQHLADHDMLTGLPNRRLLEDRLTQALAHSYRNRNMTAVMFVDLDRFKTINDSLGHAVGDALLKEVSRRLVELMRVGDTICRIGGDEFVIVLTEIRRAADAAQVAQKINESLTQPIKVDARELSITTSIGISVFPDDGQSAETLIRNADAAMYHAKELGRANYQFFTAQMNQAASSRLAVETGLRGALQHGEMRVHYQPIIELRAGCIASHEALLRWQHPTRGLILPTEFIQLAEETRLILNIGTWVLEEACRWAKSISVEASLPVAVNLSARQFMDPNLVETVAGVLKKTGLPPELLELEITESTAMQHTDLVLATMGKLRGLGVSLAIDDFGTGYSSLAYLRRFPVDKLKIDKSFLTELPQNREHRAIVVAVIALAHALGLKVVAEGVETEEQLDFLHTYHCDFIQGYLAGPPVEPGVAAKEYL